MPAAGVMATAFLSLCDQWRHKKNELNFGPAEANRIDSEGARGSAVGERIACDSADISVA